jgi:hypothetical protein
MTEVVQAFETVGVALIAGTLGPLVTTRLQARSEREAREEHDLRTLLDEGAALLVAGSNAMAHAWQRCQHDGFVESNDTREALHTLTHSYEAIRLFMSRVGIRLDPASRLRDPLEAIITALADGEAILRTADPASDRRGVRRDIAAIEDRITAAGRGYIQAARHYAGTRELMPERGARSRWRWVGFRRPPT